MTTRPRKIALIEPLGDPGIGTYTYELAEALTARGVVAHVYTNDRAWTLGKLPRHHRVYPVLGSALVRQLDRLRTRRSTRPPMPPPAPGQSGPPPGAGARPRRGLLGDGRVRTTYLALELAAWLRAQHYDLVWTQWPTMGGGPSPFWTAARAFGLRLAHTAHNIVPREIAEGERRAYDAVYRRCHVLIVHSQEAADALAREFPRVAHKIVLARHGLYTAFTRQPGARERVRAELGIPPDQRVVLCFGGLRPYKNTDAVVRAIAADRTQRLTLLVAGSETFGDDSSDPLAHTRQLVAAVGLGDRARLLAGPFGFAETGAIFEAADIVALPYLESYGSGLLLLAMSFGKRVVATRTGGMAEYVPGYPGHVLLDRATAADVLAGLHAVMDLPEASGNGRPAHLEWPAIVDEILPRLF